MNVPKWLSIEGILVIGITIIVIFTIIAPILFVVVVSFTEGETLAFPPPGFGFQWYKSAIELTAGTNWRVERLTESIFTSITIAVAVMLFSATVSIPFSYALVRLRFKGKIFFEQMVNLPLVFPLIVLGISILIMFSSFKMEAGFKGIVIAHVIITFPFVVRNCTASLHGVSLTLEEAAWTLGASWRQSFLKIVFPLMRPGIISGMLIAFIISFNEFTVTYFLFTSEIFPFPIWLFTRGTTTLDPTIFALSSAVIALDILLLIMLNRVVGKIGVSM